MSIERFGECSGDDIYILVVDLNFSSDLKKYSVIIL